MAKPDPEAGLVIRYDYLWDSRKQKGHQVGELRACVVVFVAPKDRVVVCGITHSELAPKEWRVYLDDEHREELGLDGWIDCSEVNELSWSDPGIEPTEDGHWAYGYVSDAVADEVLSKVRSQLDPPQIKWIERDHED
jgi:hypothetical protein